MREHTCRAQSVDPAGMDHRKHVHTDGLMGQTSTIQVRCHPLVTRIDNLSRKPLALRSRAKAKQMRYL